jgi:hypothetical protein
MIFLSEEFLLQSYEVDKCRQDGGGDHLDPPYRPRGKRDEAVLIVCGITRFGGKRSDEARPARALIFLFLQSWFFFHFSSVFSLVL